MGRVRGTIVLAEKPDGVEAEEKIAQAVVEYADAVELLYWEIRATLPEGLDVGTSDQLEAALRDNPLGCCMVVWMEDGT